MDQTIYNTLANHCAPLVSKLLSTTLINEPNSDFQHSFTNCLGKIVKNNILSCPEELDTTACVIKYLSQYFPSFKRSLAGAANKTLSNYFSTISLNILSDYPDCRKWSCPDLNEGAVHPRAIDAAKMISRGNYTGFLNLNYIPPEWTQVQENLRFRYDDIREKMLIVSAKYDWNNALKPKLVSSILTKLATTYDIKYVVIDEYQKLCSLMASAAKTGKFTNLIIMAHGTPNLIVLDKREGDKYEDYNLIHLQDFSCFSHLAAHGKISLFSCSTGKENSQGFPLKNIAQKIADKTQRVVVAPKDSLYPFFTSLLNPDDVVFYHPHSKLFNLIVPFYNNNILKAFHPSFKSCTKIDPQNFHDREILTGKLIHQELINKELISDSNLKAPTDYLKLCQEDPREKFLYLSALYDERSFQKPNLVSKMLAGLANRFDLKYKVIKTYDEICSEIREARKVGNLKGVVLQSVSNKNQPAILDGELKKDEHLNTTINIQKLSTCISEIDEDGTFVFMGGSIGSTPPHVGSGLVAYLKKFYESKYDTLAQQIASLSARTVLAAVCKVYASDVHLLSTDPLILNSPQYHFLTKYLYSCNSSATNLFQEYNP